MSFNFIILSKRKWAKYLTNFIRTHVSFKEETQQLVHSVRVSVWTRLFTSTVSFSLLSTSLGVETQVGWVINQGEFQTYDPVNKQPTPEPSLICTSQWVLLFSNTEPSENTSYIFKHFWELFTSGALINIELNNQFKL